MDALSLLLQGLLLAVALGASYAQDTSQSEITFPAEPGFPVSAVKGFVESPIAIKVLERPGCTAGLPDPSAPCEEDQEYGDNVRELVSRLLARSGSVNEILSDPGLGVILNDSLTPPPPPPSGLTPSVRFDKNMQHEACASRPELIFPKRARTSKKEWRFVVNQEGAKQGLIVERCIINKKYCDLGIPNNGNVRTECRQKYIYKEVFVVGSNQIEREEVMMPSTCVCYISHNNFDISSNRNMIKKRNRRKKFNIAFRTGRGNDTSIPEPQPIDV